MKNYLYKVEIKTNDHEKVNPINFTLQLAIAEYFNIPPENVTLVRTND